MACGSGRGHDGSLGGNKQLTGKGVITGTVADNTRAVIPEATVAAKNDATGITATTKSTGAGDFNFSNLDQYIHTVTSKAKGFEMLSQENIHVNAMESQVHSEWACVQPGNAGRRGASFLLERTRCRFGRDIMERITICLFFADRDTTILD